MPSHCSPVLSISQRSRQACRTIHFYFHVLAVIALLGAKDSKNNGWTMLGHGPLGGRMALKARSRHEWFDQFDQCKWLHDPVLVFCNSSKMFPLQTPSSTHPLEDVFLSFFSPSKDCKTRPHRTQEVPVPLTSCR